LRDHRKHSVNWSRQKWCRSPEKTSSLSLKQTRISGRNRSARSKFLLGGASPVTGLGNTSPMTQQPQVLQALLVSSFASHYQPEDLRCFGKGNCSNIRLKSSIFGSSRLSMIKPRDIL